MALSSFSSFILKVVTMYIVHQLTINDPLPYITSNPDCIDAGGHMCYLRQPQALCVHCSDVTLIGLDELCSSALLWLCLTTSHFIPTCSAPDMVWTWHVCSSLLLSHWCISACCIHSIRVSGPMTP